MAIRGKVNLASYDRLFPSQDLLPAGGVGNLITLPLFRPARDRNATVFLNQENLEPHRDQWSYLSTLGRMTPKEVSRAADKAGRVPAGSEVTRLAGLRIVAWAIGRPLPEDPFESGRWFTFRVGRVRSGHDPQPTSIRCTAPKGARGGG